jgi:4-diphosphocytidyl-2-C-methyl-D-erythritol kinase
MSFEPFVIAAPAKVNLALHVLGRRDDGYHELDSIVAFADRGDSLRFAPAAAFELTADGAFAHQLPAAADNIIARAWQLGAAIAQARGVTVPGAAIHLTKALPVASGIGGGSANAAATLRGLMKIAGLPPDDGEIRGAALSLGADVPVCLFGRACRMQGVGERIAALEAFRSRPALLVNPGVAVSTPAVFGRLGLKTGQGFGAPIAEAGDIRGWRNDLAPAAIALSPVIGAAIAWLAAQPGVTHAAMSGSGATCYALLDDEAQTPVPPTGWWLMRTRLG